MADDSDIQSALERVHQNADDASAKMALADVLRSAGRESLARRIDIQTRFSRLESPSRTEMQEVLRNLRDSAANEAPGEFLRDGLPVAFERDKYSSKRPEPPEIACIEMAEIYGDEVEKVVAGDFAPFLAAARQIGVRTRRDNSLGFLEGLQEWAHPEFFSWSCASGFIPGDMSPTGPAVDDLGPLFDSVFWPRLKGLSLTATHLNLDPETCRDGIARAGELSTLSLHTGNVPDEMLAAFPALQHLTLRLGSCWDEVRSCEEVLAPFKSKRLRSLSVTGMADDRKTAAVLANFPNLEELTMRDTWVKGEQTAATIAGLEQLRTLTLAASPGNGYMDICNVLDHARHAKLEEVKVAVMSDEEEKTNRLFAGLDGLPALRSLELYSPQGLAIAAPGPAHASVLGRLETLRLSPCSAAWIERLDDHCPETLWIQFEQAADLEQALPVLAKAEQLRCLSLAVWNAKTVDLRPLLASDSIAFVHVGISNKTMQRKWRKNLVGAAWTLTNVEASKLYIPRQKPAGVPLHPLLAYLPRPWEKH